MIKPCELLALNDVSTLRDYDPSLDWIAPVASYSGIILFFACLLPCVMKVWKTEQVGSGTLIGWGGLVVWALIIDLSGPALWWLTGKSQVLYYFPQGPNFIGALIMGWLSTGMLSIFVWGAKRSWCWAKRRFVAKNSDASGQ